MGRKVFISFLGTNNYVETIYQFEDGQKARPSRYIQEAILSKIAVEWSNSDIIYIFCTEQAFNANWVNNGHENVKTDKERLGLSERLQLLDIKPNVEAVKIKEGFTNAEIWEIFQTIYDKLQQEDKVYLDVTHAFRSIPIFSSTLLNYARFLKKITVDEIHYGAFEKLGPAHKVKEMSLSERVAPVLNLINIEQLQQWTHSAQMFLETGSTRYLNNMLGDKVDASLNKFFLEISEVRGLGIYEGVCANNVLEQFENLTIPNSPFEEIKKIVLNYIKPFGNNSLENLYEAVKYCYNFDLIQQGLTILSELIITKSLQLIGLNEREDFLNLYYRNAVSAALSIKKIELFDFEKFAKNGVVDEQIFKIVNAIFLLQEKSKIFDFYKSLTAGGRNDINHSGFRDNAKQVGYFKVKLAEYIEKYELYFLNKNYNPSVHSVKKQLFLINLSNHPSNTWSEQQMQAAKEQYGEIVDMAFPAVDPWADEDAIESMADVYLADIAALANVYQAKPVLHLMGEFSFTYALVNKLKAEGIDVIVSTSERQTKLNADGSKTIRFDFVRFRKY